MHNARYAKPRDRVTRLVSDSQHHASDSQQHMGVHQAEVQAGADS